MSKKRTSLDAVLPHNKPLSMKVDSVSIPLPPEKKDERIEHVGARPHVKQQALYLKHAVHRQLRILAFEEEKKMHDLCIEALDLLFANRGLPSINELVEN